MRGIVVWLSATALAVVLLIGFQVVFATSGEDGRDRDCPTAAGTPTASTQDSEATHCEPASGD